MGFINIDTVPYMELAPGVRIRAPHGKNLMLSYLEMNANSVVPMHQHPHEQAGMLLRGKLQMTIGDETRIVEPGAMYIIPANVKHTVTALDGPALILDIFSPIREDYAALANKYV
jgi:quercetin dioxygenase-like cupin family protein